MKKFIIAGTLGITALTGIGLPGVETITANAAVQEINDTVEGTVIEVTSDSLIQSSLLQNPLDQLEKKSGKVIEISGNRYTIEQDGLKITARVTSEVVHQINIGDTINIYAAEFTKSSVPNTSLVAINPIIQKNNEQNVLEKQYEKKTGKIIGKNGNRFTFKKDGLEFVARVTPEVYKLVNVGDNVNVYAPKFYKTPVPYTPFITLGIAVVEKLN